MTSDGLQGPGVPVPEATLEVGRPEKASRPRKRDSAPTSFIPHCSKCGCVKHKISRCPFVSTLTVFENERKWVARSKWLNRRKAQVVARLKYSNIDQRKMEDRPKQRSRAPNGCCQLEIARLSPLSLGGRLVEWSILRNLEGTPCPRPACSSGVLGEMVYGDQSAHDITSATVFHVCKVCKHMVPFTKNFPIYPWRSSESVSTTKQTLAM